MKVIIIPNDNKTAEEGIKDAMIEIGGVPIFFHVISLFEKRGFFDFIICDNSKTHDIRDYLNENLDKIKGLNIRLLKFPAGLKSVKILSICQKYGLENAFFVAPNDVITDLDPEKMMCVHRQNAKCATSFVVEEKKYYCALGVSNDELMKPVDVNSSFYVLEPEALEYIDANVRIDPDLIISLAENDELFVCKSDNFIQRANSKAKAGTN